tara:strand:- start:481 stop:732 length:252 start_codon:yes stop_codon:yes gene_type:complete
MATEEELEEQEEAADEALTVEEIAIMYSNVMESVALMKEINATGDDDDESLAALAANKSYIETSLARDGWTDEDLTEANALIA